MFSIVFLARVNMFPELYQSIVHIRVMDGRYHESDVRLLIALYHILCKSVLWLNDLLHRSLFTSFFEWFALVITYLV